MQRSVAIAKLTKMLGKKFGYRVNPKAPDQYDRDEAHAKLAEEVPKRKALAEQVEARRIAILQADAEYQRMKAEHEAAKKVCDQLLSITHGYRFTVGTFVNGMFFSVKAQGDSWEEVIAKLKDKQPA